jgi:hypothetical protein
MMLLFIAFMEMEKKLVLEFIVGEMKAMTTQCFSHFR